MNLVKYQFDHYNAIIQNVILWFGTFQWFAYLKPICTGGIRLTDTASFTFSSKDLNIHEQSMTYKSTLNTIQVGV